MKLTPSVLALFLGVALASSPALANDASNFDVRQLFATASSGEGGATDAVCTHSNYHYCDRYECCSGQCITCIGGAGDPFLDAEFCEGMCYPRQV